MVVCTNLQALNGLRGVGALWIALFHWSLPLINLDGDAAMGIFFCLSGFLLELNYGEAFSRGGVSYVPFLVRRLARLYPLYVVANAIALTFDLMGHPDWARGYGFGDALAMLTLTTHWLPAFAVPDAIQPRSPPMLVSWTISAFFCVYAFFPILTRSLTVSEPRHLRMLALMAGTLYLAGGVLALLSRVEGVLKAA